MPTRSHLATYSIGYGSSGWGRSGYVWCIRKAVVLNRRGIVAAVIRRTRASPDQSEFCPARAVTNRHRSEFSATSRPPYATASGAVEAILLDPELGPNTMFIGSPNGGIWEMTNGGAARPHPMLFGVLAVPVLAVYCQPGARPYRSNGSDSPRIVAS